MTTAARNPVPTPHVPRTPRRLFAVSATAPVSAPEGLPRVAVAVIADDVLVALGTIIRGIIREEVEAGRGVRAKRPPRDEASTLASPLDEIGERRAEQFRALAAAEVRRRGLGQRLK